MYFIIFFIVTACFQVSFILVHGHYGEENDSNILNITVSETYKPVALVHFPVIRRSLEDIYKYPMTTVQPKRNWRRIFRQIKYRKHTTPVRVRRLRSRRGKHKHFWPRARRDNGGTRKTNPPIHMRTRFNQPDLSKYRKVTQEARAKRTTPHREEFDENCEYHSHYCLRAYNTGIICGRTHFAKYFTFNSYCMLDYVNCMERYELWTLAHMGPCFNMSSLYNFPFYRITDDYWLDQNIQPEIFSPIHVELEKLGK